MLLWTRPSVSASTQVMTPNAKANHLNDKKLRLSYISRNPESECCQLIDSLRFIDSLRTHVLAIFFFSLLESCWCSFRHNISQCPVVEESCLMCLFKRGSESFLKSPEVYYVRRLELNVVHMSKPGTCKGIRIIWIVFLARFYSESYERMDALTELGPLLVREKVNDCYLDKNGWLSGGL